MSKHWRGFKDIVFDAEQGTSSEHEDCDGTFIMRNSEHSKSDNTKKFLVLAQVITFL